MDDTLNLLNLQLEGRHHSGIDDTKNITRIILELLKHGFKFTQGMILNENK